VGTRYHTWLRHYATSWKVAGSIPDVIEFLNPSNPSSRTMGLVLTQHLREINTTNIPGNKGRSEHKANKLTAICKPIV
jgi:hypothetical protein